MIMKPLVPIFFHIFYICLTGTSESVKKAKELLLQYAKTIVSDTCDVKKRLVCKYFASDKGKDGLRDLQSNVPCVIEEKRSGFSKTVLGRGPTRASNVSGAPKLVASVDVKRVKVCILVGNNTIFMT